MTAHRFVLDNSVVMAWCFEDEASRYADAILDLPDSWEAFVPSVWTLELINVLLVAERHKRIDRARATRFMGLVATLPIKVESESPSAVMNEVYPLARECGLSAYDASYLNLALQRGLPIATQDKQMKRAAKRIGVTLMGA